MNVHIFQSGFKAFIITSFFFFISFSKGNAQIIYKDANPDIEAYGPIYLDLDSNGINDFSAHGYFYTDILHALHYEARISAVVNGSNAIATDTLSNPLNFISGNLIDSNSASTWCDEISDTVYLISNCIFYNMNSSITHNWSTSNNQVTGFLGVRFLSNNQIHYCWIRMTVTCGHITIHDWAYNTQPDSGIVSADGWLAGISIQPGNKLEKIITIDHSIFIGLDENSNATISVYDCLGQLVSKKENASGETKMEMENINSGIYFVEVSDGEKFYRKKIFLR